MTITRICETPSKTAHEPFRRRFSQLLMTRDFDGCRWRVRRVAHARATAAGAVMSCRFTRPSVMVMRVAWLCLGVLFIGWLGYRVGFQQIATMLARLRSSIILVLALYAAHQFARAAALTFCIPPHQALRFTVALSIRLAGEAVEFLTFAGPIASEPTKAKLLGRAGMDVREGLAATLTEYVANMISGTLIAAISMGYILAILHPSGTVRVVSTVVLVATASSFVAIVSFCVLALECSGHSR